MLLLLINLISMLVESSALAMWNYNLTCHTWPCSHLLFANRPLSFILKLFLTALNIQIRRMMVVFKVSVGIVLIWKVGLSIPCYSTRHHIFLHHALTVTFWQPIIEIVVILHIIFYQDLIILKDSSILMSHVTGSTRLPLLIMKAF